MFRFIASSVSLVKFLKMSRHLMLRSVVACLDDLNKILIKPCFQKTLNLLRQIPPIFPILVTNSRLL